MERDGKFVFDPTTLEAAPKSNGEKRLLREKKELELRVEQFTKLFGDKKPEDIAAILEAHEEGADDSKKGKGEVATLAKQIKELTRLNEELTGKVKTLEPFKGKYEDSTLDTALREAATKAGVLPSDMKAVLKIVKGDHARLDEKTGKVIVVDEDGDDTGLTAEKFFGEKFKAEYPKFYAAQGGSGGGSTGGGSGSGAPRTDGKIDIKDANAFVQNVDKIASGQVKAVAA